MNDEELQHRLRRLDPSAGVSVHPAGGPRAALLMEQIMNTATATPTVMRMCVSCIRLRTRLMSIFAWPTAGRRCLKMYHSARSLSTLV